jgi:hypothetical protein
VLVDRVDRLVRLNHRRDFRPYEVGIAQRRGAADIDAQVDLTEVIEVEGPAMRIARQRLLSPASRPVGLVHVVRAFGSGQ